MTPDNWLFALVVIVLVRTVWIMITNKVTDAERDAMLADEEMWP